MPQRRFPLICQAPMTTVRTLEMTSRVLLCQDYATGRFEANMPQRAAELRRILTGLGPSFAKASRGALPCHAAAHAVRSALLLQRSLHVQSRSFYAVRGKQWREAHSLCWPE